MLAEIIQEGYDSHGRKVSRPRPPDRGKRHYRILHPTFPMGRYVLKPLNIVCSSLEEMRLFLKGCTYVSDQEQFGRDDYWLPPDEFEQRRKGDCEDFALWTWRQLMHMGYSTRFVVGHAGAFSGGHAWVTMEKDGRGFLVEPLACRAMTFPRLATLRYKPLVSVEWDGENLHYFTHEDRPYNPSLRQAVKLPALVVEWLLYMVKAWAPWLGFKFLMVFGWIVVWPLVWLLFWLARLTPWDLGRGFTFGLMARRAFNRGRYREARYMAEELLHIADRHPDPEEFPREDAIHQGHIVLGRLALKNGKVEEARHHLLRAAQVPGSPVLMSYGPSMSLARELLEHGEVQVIVDYLELCREFWRMERGNLDRWTAQVLDGEIPDFGPNLNY
jgi:hypothetical protein